MTALALPFDVLDLDIALVDAAGRADAEKAEMLLPDDPFVGQLMEYALLHIEAEPKPLSPFDQLVAAKQARDVVRDTIIKALRTAKTDLPELLGLLRADELATEALAAAQANYSQCVESVSTEA